jgi:hypothetical protein
LYEVSGWQAVIGGAEQKMPVEVSANKRAD